LKICGLDEIVGDRNFVGLARTSVVDGEGVLALDLFSDERKSVHAWIVKDYKVSKLVY
jgi:hypothetical protein